MTRRNQLLLLAALAVALAAVLLVPACRWRVVGWARGEPFYRGRPTSYWRSEILALLERYGYTTMAIQPVTLVDELKWRTGIGTPEFYSRAWPFLDDDVDAVPVLTALLRDRNAYLRVQAAERLAHLGPRAKAAVPALIAALPDWRIPDEDRTCGKVGASAAYALKRIDPEAAKTAGVKP